MHAISSDLFDHNTLNSLKTQLHLHMSGELDNIDLCHVERSGLAAAQLIYVAKKDAVAKGLAFNVMLSDELQKCLSQFGLDMNNGN